MNIKTKLLISLSITLTEFIIINPIVKADYIPPAEQERASDYSKSTGVRTGFESDDKTLPLVILAPISYVGQTFSTTPTFVWAYGNPDHNYQINFRLFEFDEQGNPHNRGKPIIINSKGGIITLPFQSEMSPLELGKKYLWQISVNNSQQKLIWQRAEIKVVKMPFNLANQITNLNLEKSEKAELYAKYGFWYDALTESLPSSFTGELGNLGQDLVCNLAELENIYSSNAILYNTEGKKKTIAQRIADLRIFCQPNQ